MAFSALRYTCGSTNAPLFPFITEYPFHEPARTTSQNAHSRPFLLSRPHSRSKVRPTTATTSHHGGVAAAHSIATVTCPLSPFTSLAHLISQFTCQCGGTGPTSVPLHGNCIQAPRCKE